MWDVIARNYPFELLATNLLYEGGVFEGDVFRATLNDYLRLKLGTTGDPQFRDLPIPLAVIATDIKNASMVVYSSEQNPTMPVADAVRQSMSIPFVFQPLGNDGELVDGGLVSNYPLWLFTKSGDRFWASSDTVLKNRYRGGVHPIGHGHATLQEVERYTRDAQRSGLADSGFEKLGTWSKRERVVANHPKRFAKKEGK